MDAFTQLHVARKLSSALPVIDGLVKPANAGKDKRILSVLMLSQIDDRDADFIIKKCLSVVNLRQDNGQAAKVTGQDGTLMFDFVTMSEILELTVAVLEENLGDFFRTALASLEQEKGQGAV